MAGIASGKVDGKPIAKLNPGAMSFKYDAFWRSAWEEANASTPPPLSGRVPRVYVYRLPETSPLKDQRDPREYSHHDSTVNNYRLKWDSRYGTLGTNPERSLAIQRLSLRTLYSLTARGYRRAALCVRSFLNARILGPTVEHHPSAYTVNQAIGQCSVLSAQ